ncbi:hypothetical protein GCM10010468_17920 [Actinocorallia longicatena]|uniref:Histidine kinase/HSP90-like ATPase domain-containing protein n=1 Tax=Actinocorallia longicatena TaxID=111803 RepID=A0ABP6Q581_9ACTN
MAVSELVTNACRHSRSARPGGTVALSAAFTRRDGLTLTVTDQGSDDERGPQINPAGRCEGGLGLGICRAFGHLEIAGDAATGWCVRLRMSV